MSASTTDHSLEARLERFLLNYGIFLILLVGLLFRLWLATYDGLVPDLALYQRWAYEISHGGPAGYYDVAFTDYLPIYLYVLAGLGLLSKQFGEFSLDTWYYLFKIPPIIADIISAYLLYLFLDMKSQRIRLLAAVTYLALPTVLFIGALWGQSDSILALLLMACVYFTHKGWPVATAVAFVVAFFMKPLAIAALPLLAIWILRDYKPTTWVACIAAAFVLTLIIVWPFYPWRPWDMISEAYDNTSNTTFTSSFTYNFFGTFGWQREDSMKTLGLSWHHWGFALFGLAQAFIIAGFWRTKNAGAYALGVAVSMLAAYTFMSRMHERYMFSAFLPLLAACFYYNRKVLWGSFVALTVAQFCQLYIAFYTLSLDPFSDFVLPPWLNSPRLVDWLTWTPSWWDRPGSFVQAVISVLVVATVVVLIAFAYLPEYRVHFRGGFRIDRTPAEQPT